MPCDNAVHYLVSGLCCLNINVWQHWRGVSPLFVPSVNLVNRCGRIGHDSDSWFYEINQERVFEGRDWKIGSLERHDKDEYTLTGQYAICSGQWLQTFLDSRSLRLAYVLRLTVKHRKHEYEDAAKFHSSCLLNLGSVVT